MFNTSVATSGRTINGELIEYDVLYSDFLQFTQNSYLKISGWNRTGTKFIVQPTQLNAPAPSVIYFFNRDGSSAGANLSVASFSDGVNSTEPYLKTYLSGDGLRLFIVDSQNTTEQILVYLFNGSAWVQEQVIVPNQGSGSDPILVPPLSSLHLQTNYDGSDFYMSTFDGIMVYHRTGTTWALQDTLNAGVVGELAQDASVGWFQNITATDQLIARTDSGYETFTRTGAVWTKDTFLNTGTYAGSFGMSQDGNFIYINTDVFERSGSTWNSHSTLPGNFIIQAASNDFSLLSGIIGNISFPTNSGTPVIYKRTGTTYTQLILDVDTSWIEGMQAYASEAGFFGLRARFAGDVYRSIRLAKPYTEDI